MIIKPQNIVFIVSFFIYSGYYIGLSLLFHFGMSDLSRFYSIPLRLFLVVLMLYFINDQYKYFKSNPTVVLTITGFTVLYILKVLYSDSVINTLSRGVLDYIFYFIAFCTIPFIFFSKMNILEYVEYVKKGIIYSGFILALLTIFIFYEVLISGGIDRISKLTHQTGDAVISPLSLAYSGALTIVTCLYCIIFDNIRTKLKVFYIIIIIISLIPFFLGATRGALLAIILCSILFLINSNVKRRFAILFFFIISIPLLGYLINLTGTSLIERSNRSVDSGDVSGREVLWADAIKEFVSNPLFGGRIEVSGIYPHNIYLEVLMATGFFGGILFIILQMTSLSELIKFPSKDRVFILVLFLSAFAQYMFTGGLWSSILFFSALGMMNSYSE